MVEKGSSQSTEVRVLRRIRPSRVRNAVGSMVVLDTDVEDLSYGMTGFVLTVGVVCVSRGTPL